MSIFSKLIKENKREPRKLDFLNYDNEAESVDLTADKIYKDLQKRTNKKLQDQGVYYYANHEAVVEESNYNGFMELSRSSFFASRVAGLIRLLRVNVLFYNFASTGMNTKDKENLIVDLIEAKSLLIHAITKLYAKDEEKVVEWYVDDIVTVGELSFDDEKIVEITKKLLNLTSTICNYVADGCVIDFKKVAHILKFENIFEKTFPKTL